MSTELEVQQRRPVYLSDRKQVLGILPTLSFWMTRSPTAKVVIAGGPAAIGAYLGVYSTFHPVASMVAAFSATILGLGFFERFVVRPRMRTRPDE